MAAFVAPRASAWAAAVSRAAVVVAIAGAVGTAGALGMARPAAAADLKPAPAPMPYKGPTFTAPVYNWSGFYLGAHIGGGWSHSTATDNAGGNFAAPAGASLGISGSGLLGGPEAGFNYQTGPWVFGIEGAFDFSDVHGSTASPLFVGGGVSTRLNWVGTVTGRVGFTLGKALFYAKGGGAFGNVNFDVNHPGVGVFTATDTSAGWTIGAGAEYALTKNLSVKAEYDYLDLGTHTFTATSPGTPPITADAKITEHMIKLGADYKFHWR